ncbi:MAG: hypothetical protein J0H98_09745 [Solirubrobacterales bacterium]|nr:hypothetical protein [Solirubrobacterales bacterium]
MTRAIRLYEPRAVEVAVDGRGRPIQVDDVDVVHIREQWVVEDGWWTAEPIRRLYFELVLFDGRDLTVFRSLRTGLWFSQRA